MIGKLVAALCAGVGAASVIGIAQGSAASPATTTVRFGYTGAEQTFTVPAGVTSLQVVAVGAEGGTGSTSGANIGGTGGFGAQVQTPLAVTPGEILFIEVGGNGANGGATASGGGGGFNGGGSSDAGVFNTPGGGGGGATDIRTCSMLATTCKGVANTLNSRLLVAAGGGGGGSEGQEASGTGGGGGAGGAAGQTGQSTGCNSGATPGGGGGAGTQTAGGAGGAHGNPASTDVPDGNPGVLGQGGGAGSGSENSQPGGGGGGGYFGGGAGGSANGCAAGGGGGGSNLTPSSNASISMDTTGVPSVTLTYTPTTTTTTPPPQRKAIISNATQTHKRWREPMHPRLAQISRKRSAIGTTFSFALNQAAPVSLRFTRAAPGRAGALTRGRLSFAGHEGRNTVKFYGWLSRSRKLEPGKYALVITAATRGMGSSSQTLTFTIVK